MRRNHRTLNDYEMQRNAEVGLFTRPSIFAHNKEVKQIISLDKGVTQPEGL